jgi:glycosyltransferase involved in cell wall biosynthesis
MKNSSDSSFRVAYFLDTFPRRTENFILREIAGVIKFWPRLRIYCFNLGSSDWEYIDCADVARGIPHNSLQLSLHRALTIHFKWLASRPLRYLMAFWQAFRLHQFNGILALRRFDQAVRLSHFAKRDHVAHLHAHFASEPAVVCHLAARILSIHYSISAHAEDIWAHQPKKRVMEGATACVACTAEGRDYLQRQFPSARVHLVRHGLFEVSSQSRTGGGGELRPAPPPLRIISAGRLIAKKGFDTLINACSRLSQSGIDYQCDIFGEGELKDSLNNQIHRFGLQNRIKLHSFLPHKELNKKMSAAHLCVLPCRVDPKSGNRDGIPNVLLEAIASGAIVVTSDHATMREVIEDNISGFLAPPDDPSALANTIRQALQVKTDWPRIRQDARCVLYSDFTLEKNLDLLRRIIGKQS